MSVRARTAHLLLMLKDRFATVTEDGSLSFELPLSRKDMASIVGTRPETIARTIRSLEADGVTRFSGRRVTVHDLDALLDEVEREQVA
jgi:CRP/FNR family transcriptional regulator